MHLDAVDGPFSHQLPQQRHTLVHRRVGEHHHGPGGLCRGQHLPHRRVSGGVEALAPRLPAEQLVIKPGVDAVAQAQLLQRLHDAALEEDAAVLRIFQRLLGAELGVQRLDLPAALQSALVAALAHDVAVPAQGRAVEVGPEGQQVDAVAALEVVAGELGGGDEPHAVLHRVVVGVPGAECGVVVREGSERHLAARHQGQAVDGDRAVRTGGMGMKVASHKLLSLDFYRFLRLVYHKNHRGTREPYTALPPTVRVEERMWWVRTTSASSPPIASSSSTERVVEQRTVRKVMVSMPSARSWRRVAGEMRKEAVNRPTRRERTLLSRMLVSEMCWPLLSVTVRPGRERRV